MQYFETCRFRSGTRRTKEQQDDRVAETFAGVAPESSQGDILWELYESMSRDDKNDFAKWYELASKTDPESEPLDYQEELDQLVGEADEIRERAIQLMAMPYVDAAALRWMVDGTVRHGGEHFTLAT